jgi:DNA-directed RNA polymerase subunit RPC12/RpoP
MSDSGMRIYVCSICGKIFRTNIVTVTEESRKNRRGRIAWGRDAVCNECVKREREKNDDR